MESTLLSTKLAGLQLDNPLILASGVMGYTAESLNRVAKGGAGAVVTKSIGAQARVGLPKPNRGSGRRRID